MANLDESTARERLASVPVVRLATVGADGRPHLVVTTFAPLGDAIVTAVDHKPKRTRDLQRLRNIRAEPRVTLLADHYEDDWTRLWWVRADGHAEIHDARPGLIEPLCARYPQYRDTPPAGPVILITVTRWTGWTSGI